MKFLLDENVTPDAVSAIQSIYLDHHWMSAHDDPEAFCDVDDLDLFPVLSSLGFDGIVTQDKNQLTDETERAGLVESNLAWIGFKNNDWPGLQGLALRTSTLIAGLFYVFDDWRDAPHSYHLRGVEALPSQRLRIRALDHA